MSPGGGETDLNATSQESVWAAFHCACVRTCVGDVPENDQTQSLDFRCSKRDQEMGNYSSDLLRAPSKSEERRA